MADFGRGKLLPGGMEQFRPKSTKDTDKFYEWKDQNYPKNEDEWVRPRRIMEPVHRKGGMVKNYCAGGKVIKSYTGR